VADLTEDVFWLNGLRGKSQPTHSPANVLSDVKMLTFADDVTDALIMMVVLWRRHLYTIQQICVTIYGDRDIMVDEPCQRDTQMIHFVRQSLEKRCKRLSFKINIPIATLMDLARNSNYY
jgi:hypothetical protein